MKFKSNFSPRERVAVDLSNHFAENYIELAPYAVDDETGEIINDSPYPKIVRVDDIDIQKQIDSYAQDCDIYNIIRRSQQGLDVSYAFKEKSYADLSNIPENNLDQLKQAQDVSKVVMTDELKDALLKNLSDDEILSILKKKVQADTTPAEPKSEVTENVA